MIFTNGKGAPFDRPARADYPEGWGGTRAWLEALHQHKNQISDLFCLTFDKAFPKALKAKDTN